MTAQPANSPQSDTAGAIARPPLLYLGAFLAGLSLDWAWPAPFLPGAVQYAAGGALAALGLALAAWAMVHFRRAGTPVPTWLPTMALVVVGPYRLTRNPIYVGLAALFAGAALAVDSLWLVAALVPLLLVIDRGVIAREERYLARRFGAAYEEFRRRTRRWI